MMVTLEATPNQCKQAANGRKADMENSPIYYPK